MNYQKITKSVAVTTEGGATATGGSLSIGDLERHGTIYADKLVPFHAVDIAVVTEQTESATKPDPYGCEDGGGICAIAFEDQNVQFSIPEYLDGYVNVDLFVPKVSNMPDSMTVTIDGVKWVLPRQTSPFPEGEYYALEPASDKPGSPSITTSLRGSELVLSLFAKEEDVAPGTYSLTIEFCYD